LERAIGLNSNDFATWHNKAIALTKLGKKEEAKEAKEIEKRLKNQKPEKASLSKRFIPLKKLL
jgi:Flp pilus assembly protein TadD